MRILAIETSCDETSISLLEAKRGNLKILSNIVTSQIKVHKKWGGVVPTLAKREHQKSLVPVLKKALTEASLLKKARNTETPKPKLKEILIREDNLYKKLKKFLANYQKPKVDMIAVTIGPGLEPALWVGVNFARALGYSWHLPIISVNHIEAHIIANFLNNFKTQDLFPVIALIVSGGHTQLILMRKIRRYQLLGETRDDAAGECLDKIARILGLGYPGGPIISQLAKETARGPASGSLPRPMINQKNYDFSFSGLKTAVLYLVKQLTINNQQLTIKQRRQICFETQQAIINVLIKKTLKAAKNYRAKAILLGGGVVANKELRKQFREKIRKEIPNTKYLIPDTKFCTDNAAMIAITAYFCRRERHWTAIKADANLQV